MIRITYAKHYSSIRIPHIVLFSEFKIGSISTTPFLKETYKFSSSAQKERVNYYAMTNKVPARDERVEAALRCIKLTEMSLQVTANKNRVTKGTLRNKPRGKKPRSDPRSHDNLLEPFEEEALIRYVLELDATGHHVALQDIAQAADCLLLPLGKPLASISWAVRFIERTPRLEACLLRASRIRSTPSGGPVGVSYLFREFDTTRQNYKIQERDIYIMDEGGFHLGPTQPDNMDALQAGMSKDTPSGNKDWATAIVCISGGKIDVPPFIIFKSAQRNISIDDADLPPQWKICLTDKEWTSEEIAIEWIKHFNEHTSAAAAQGRYRMLILDDRTSHFDVKFKRYCREHKIILVFVLRPHSSHYTHPLELDCLRSLRQHYSQRVNALVQGQHASVDEMSFLTCFKESYSEAITESSIEGAFEKAGLIPYNPELGLSRLRAMRNSAASRMPRQLQEPPRGQQ